MNNNIPKEISKPAPLVPEKLKEIPKPLFISEKSKEKLKELSKPAPLVSEKSKEIPKPPPLVPEKSKEPLNPFPAESPKISKFIITTPDNWTTQNIEDIDLNGPIEPIPLLTTKKEILTRHSATKNFHKEKSKGNLMKNSILWQVAVAI